MTKLDEILEAIERLQESVDLLLGASVEVPAEPAPMVPLIVDALSIVRAEEAAVAREKMKGLRKRNMVGLPEDYEGHVPYATGL